MGLANWLTVLRIVLIPVFVSLMVYRKPGAGLLVFAVAALTDLLDGWVARRSGPSRLGAFLDPMADKPPLTAAFVTLTHMRGGRLPPRPTLAGKLATFFQVLVVLSGLLARYFRLPLAPRAIIWLAAAFTIVSGLQYIVQGMRLLNAAHGATPEEDRESAYYR